MTFDAHFPESQNALVAHWIDIQYIKGSHSNYQILTPLHRIY